MQDIMKIASEAKIKGLKNIDILTIDGNGKYYIQQQGKNYVTGNFALQGDSKW